VDGELALMRAHRVRVLVAKNSGGDQTSAKLAASRALGIDVVMIDPPAAPADPISVSTVAEALTLLDNVVA
jgi:precorrin-6A/cobalt-precorrin-6A reductase